MALHCQVLPDLGAFCGEAFWLLAANLVGEVGNLVEESSKELPSTQPSTIRVGNYARFVEFLLHCGV